MQGALSTATWFWLFVPMMSVLALSIATWLLKK